MIRGLNTWSLQVLTLLDFSALRTYDQVLRKKTNTAHACPDQHPMMIICDINSHRYGESRIDETSRNYARVHIARPLSTLQHSL